MSSGAPRRAWAWDFDEAARRAGVPLLAGPRSLKSVLDVDWDDPAQKKAALETLLSQVRDLGAFLERELSEERKVPPLCEQWAVVEQFIGQDIEPDPEGGGSRIKEGVAQERRISVRDGQMRHGRKSKSSRVDGYKRHIAVDLDSKLIMAAAVTDAGTVTCPAGATADLVRGATARFPTSACGLCDKRERCTQAPARHLAIHREEPFLVELRDKQKTAEGRQDLRKRVIVEHRLAALGLGRQRRARYIGVRKNLFDERRHAAIANLHVAAA